MNVNVKIIDAKTYQILITESDDHKPHEKQTWVRHQNSLEIIGRHDGNNTTIRLRTSALTSMVVEEGEQVGSIILYTPQITLFVKYAYYKMGNLSKEINHKFKEDVGLLEDILVHSA